MGATATEPDPLGILWRKANPGNAVFPYLDPVFASGLGFFLHFRIQFEIWVEVEDLPFWVMCAGEIFGV